MATTVGLLHLELHVAQAFTLKDKRRVIQSFKTKLSNQFNVSVAEVDALDSHRRAVLAVAMVSNDKTYIEGALQKVVNLAGSHRDMILLGHDVEWL